MAGRRLHHRGDVRCRRMLVGLSAAAVVMLGSTPASASLATAPRTGDLPPSWATATATAIGASPKSSGNSVESAHVTGPIPRGPVGDPSHNYPFFSARQNLAGYGYTEQEFYFSGTTLGGPYTSRMLVRRPTSPARFSGTVVVEWFNVSTGYD